MAYRVAADAVLLLHLAFIVYVCLGGLLAARWRWLPIVHLPAAAWGVWIELSGRVCPLTPLENRLRVLAGQEGYGGDFVAHYLLGVIYPDWLAREVQFALAALVLVVNAAIYAWLWRRR